MEKSFKQLINLLSQDKLEYKHLEGLSQDYLTYYLNKLTEMMRLIEEGEKKVCEIDLIKLYYFRANVFAAMALYKAALEDHKTICSLLIKENPN